MRTLIALALLFGVFWWFAPQATRERVAAVGRSGTARAATFVAHYREPAWDWATDVAGTARDKALALFRTQLHRAVDENVQ